MKKFGSIAFISLVVLLLTGAMFVLSLMKHPMGVSLALDDPPDQSPAENARQPATPAFQSEKTCGNTGTMSIIVVGQGLVENSRFYRSGALRLVVVNFNRPGVSILSMPSELWVDAKALKDPATPFEMLDLIYHKAFLNSGKAPEDVAHVKGTQALAQAVVDNFAFVPDHYVTILQQPFIELVDILGGIDVDLPEAIDTGRDDFDFPAGPQHLDGTRALNLARVDAPAGYNAWARFERQDILLQGLLEAAMRPENWANAPELVKQARKAVLTDLSVDQAMDLKCMLAEVGSQRVMLQVEEDMVTIDDQGHWNPDFQAIQALIQGMYGE